MIDGRMQRGTQNSTLCEKECCLKLQTSFENSIDSSIALKKVENKALIDAGDNLKNVIRETSSVTQKNDETRLSTWYSATCALLNIEKRELAENTLAFEFSNPSNATEHSPRLTLTATFANVIQPAKYFKLIEAEVNVSSLTADEEIKIAIQRNDCRYLLLKLNDMWKKHFPLLNEVAAIRKSKYPIDWMVEENEICILLGTRSTIKCVLRISPGYPSQGEINIEDISELPQGMDVGNLKPPGSATPSLLTWIEYLANTFSKL